MRINQNIPDDMPLQQFDYEDASYIVLVKPSGDWGIDLRDDDTTHRQLALGLIGIAIQLLQGEDNDSE